MKFLIRPGTDPIARADAMLLSAMGLPGGGIVKVGKTHVLIRPGEVTDSSALMLGERTMANAGVRPGETLDVKRILLPQAQRVVLAGDELPLEPRQAARSLQGIPVTVGDRVVLDPSYGSTGPAEPIVVKVAGVIPEPAGTVGSATVVGSEGDMPPSAPVVQPQGRPTGEPPTTAVAMLTGLETELETLAGWLALLTAPGNLPATWGLPSVAGVTLEGPSGVGKSELVSAAASAAGAAVREISLELVFKPEKLLDLVEKGVKESVGPAVIFLDRLDAVAGDEGMFRNQMGAVLRWFLDAVAEKPRLACVLGVSSLDALNDAIATSPLLPRKMTIPHPDLQRRRLLFEAALSRVPSDEIDFDVLAAKSAGFSGADVMAAVVHASAMVVRSGGRATTGTLLAAIGGTTPSLGSVSLGEIPSYGFERVANLDEVKQRLTEAVIWPIQSPERFETMGIEPPRGILLHGPAGTGKTFVTRALAHEAGAAFFSVKGAELLDKFVGESERGVRELFARARSVAPSIIFFDEFDALAPVRGSSNNSVTDSVVAALLTEIDGVSDRGDVVIIGATNRKDLIDPALLRGGRLETHILLGLPPKASRLALLNITDVPFADDVDLDRLADVTGGLSFADLTSLLREAALNVLRDGREALEVTWADLEEALKRFNKEFA